MSENEPKIRRRKITDYTPDPKNANKGSERGWRMVNDSLQQDGAARSIVVTADDTIIAGNKTSENAVDVGITEVIEIETDGHQLVVVKRKDWESADDPNARRYAFRDNRAAETSLDWDVDRILEAMSEGVQLDGMWQDWEIEQMIATAPAPDNESEWQGMPEFEQNDLEAVHSIKVNFRTLDDLQRFAEQIDQKLSEKTKSVWFPAKPRENLQDVAWVSDES